MKRNFIHRSRDSKGIHETCHFTRAHACAVLHYDLLFTKEASTSKEFIMARYIPIGTPINRGEVEGLRLLRDRLPAHYTLIGNFELQLPQRRNTLEFDAIILGDHGIYVIEIKGWSGVIHGDIRRWQLPWKRVESPFIRNEVRAKALRSFLSQMIPNLPHGLCCESIVYLPSSKADITLNDPREERLLRRDQEREFFEKHAFGERPLLNNALREDIKNLLVPLSKPAKLTHKIPNYAICENLSHPRLPYYEYIAQHDFIRARGRVRIKTYTIDALLAPKHRDETYASTLSEIEALHTLEHSPYVARAYELIRDEEDDLVFHVVSEWISSRTMRDLFDDTPTPIEALPHEQHSAHWQLAAHMTRAVAMLHAHRITHRNLTPHSFALTSPSEASSRVPFKLINFDFARVGRFEGHEQTRRRIVSLGYGAPELWMGTACTHDHRVDIYALGAIIFELLAGQPLYHTSHDELLRHDEIWELRKHLLPDEACRQLIGHMLAYTPSDRLDDLDEALAFFVARAHMKAPDPLQLTS